jgi:hypothetical protein
MLSLKMTAHSKKYTKEIQELLGKVCHVSALR